MRIERIGEATLYLGDCAVILPAVSADVLVTDPPYGVSFTGKIPNDGRRTTEGYASFADNDPEYILGRVRAAIGRTTRAAITPGIRLMPNYPQWSDMGCIFVPGGVGIGRWGFCCAHPILYYGPRPKYKGMKPSSFESLKPMPSDMRHPTSKPLEWMVKLIDIASVPGETVMDPFMGSGTTGVACVNTGRSFIGIEIEPRYFDIACERISAAYAQQRLFA